MILASGVSIAEPPPYSPGHPIPSPKSVTRGEVEVMTYEREGAQYSPLACEAGGVATAVWAPSKPSLEIETTLSDYDEYEVRIYGAHRRRLLVAAIELVSPANKDRPEHRNLFVAKCAALIQKGVAVSIVDTVT
jgi:hypothetical protein